MAKENSKNSGYYSQPTISAQYIAFISDDDLWIVEKEGGVARRLTSNRGHISSPCFSEDGQHIAFISQDHSDQGDVYLISVDGGEAQRLTWIGANRVTLWKDSKTLYFTSGIEAYPRREHHVYELNIETRDFKKVDLGPASFYCKQKDLEVLARNSGDSARWKRYQGGTAGVLWTKKAAGKFQRILKNIKTNLTRPVIIDQQIYFISDHEGVGNLYVCNHDGKSLKRLTNHLDYYARALRGQGQSLVYQCGAEIYVYDLVSKSSARVEIQCPTTGVQSISRFENWRAYLKSFAISANASELGLVTRGHLFKMGPFDGPVRELDANKDVGYSRVIYSFDDSKIYASGSHGLDGEALYQFDVKTGTRSTLFAKRDWGKIWNIQTSPKADLLAVVTNRQEIFVVDPKKQSLKLIEKVTGQFSSHVAWSPDGRYVAYSAACDLRRIAIKIYDTQTSQVKILLDPVSYDTCPTWDPEGKYLYFIGVRDFAPQYNETHFDLGFPVASRLFAVALNSKVKNPFEATIENPSEAKKEDANAKAAKKGSKAKTASKEPEVKIEIEFDGIQNRILAFPLELGGYHSVTAFKGGVKYLREAPGPIAFDSAFADATSFPNLYQFKFEEGQAELLQKNVSALTSNSKRTQFLIRSEGNLRILQAGTKPSSESKPGKKDGFVDSNRLRLKIDPKLEWQQMYAEAWLLQKEHFWRKDLNKIDWQLVFDRYLKLLSKVKTRAEFSDLIWEMQGELGTSHCYEMAGDYDRTGARNSLARLGAYLSYLPTEKAYRIDRVLNGDSWNFGASASVNRLSVQLKIGDKIHSIDGQKFSMASDLYEFLENKANCKVELEVSRASDGNARSKSKVKTETLTVKPSGQIGNNWYRDFVESNKAYVHKVSKGRFGYVHIPDMGPFGYSEFYRNFITESQYEGLVVDVRYNGGGHVSQHLLKILAQKVLGFDETRHQGVESYPTYAPGALVALANEHSGSDGDIFPQSFKMMKLGKLVGKRTWGGVIGINGQYRLRDGTYVTQPEYSFWFRDSEWQVENYGVDPDIEVDITPEDWKAKKDPQLDRAIAELEKEVKRNPKPKFQPTYYPDLSLPKILKRK